MTVPRTGLPASRRNDGFTMVVIAALFIAFAVIAAAAVERNSTTQLITRRDAAVKQLQRLNNALIEYSVFNASGTTLIYPCPASPLILTTSGAFGTTLNNGAAPPVDDCSTNDHPADGLVVLGTDVIKGMVPVQALSPYGIGLNDAFDPWNNRIMYVVNRQLTKGGTKSTTNNPTVTQFVTSLAITPPDFILISYGRDGMGAYRRDRTVIDIPCLSTGTYNKQNCSTGTTTFYESPTFTVGAATGGTGLNAYFDDVLSYHTQ